MKIGIIVAICITLILVQSSLAAELTVNPEDSLSISISVAEENIQPGETINFRITFKNIGSQGMTDLQYEVIAGTDISGYPSGEVLLGGLAAGNGMTREIPLSISGSANTGIHTISIKAEYIINLIGYKTQKNYNFQVGSDVTLHLEDVSFKPEQLEPGKNAKLLATIRNVGSDDAKQLIAEFNASSTDIKPVLGATSFVREISAGGIGVFELDISIESSAETKTYDATLLLDYEDSEGNELSDTLNLGLPVQGTPMLEVLNTEIDAGEFEVELENLGSGKAKAIKLELVQNGKIMGVDIDNELKADKHTTLRFDTFQAGTAELMLSYLDEENQEYTDTLTVSIPKSAGGAGFSFGGIILFILVIAEAVYIYKLRKKLKAK